MSLYAVPLKADDILVPSKLTSWDASFREVRVVSVTAIKGKEYAWLEWTPKTGSTFLDTLSVEDLRKGFVRKPSFFRLGKTYKFPGSRDDTWTILDLYQIDNPTSWSGRQKAVARMVQPDGMTDIQTLSVHDFQRMVEA